VSSKGELKLGAYPRYTLEDGLKKCYDSQLNLTSSVLYMGYSDLEWQFYYFDGRDYIFLDDIVGVDSVLLRYSDQCQKLSRGVLYSVNTTSFCCEFKQLLYSGWTDVEKVSIGSNGIFVLIIFILFCVLKCKSSSMAVSHQSVSLSVPQSNKDKD